MFQTIFAPTRINKKSATLIDNIFINCEHSHEGKVIASALSDHEGQILQIDQETYLENQNVTYKARIFSEHKLQQFKIEIKNASWESILNESDPNFAYNKFENIVHSTITRLFPLKKIKSKQSSVKNWITNGIKNSCKKKRILYKQMLSGSVSRHFYDKYTKVLRNVIKMAKKLSYKHYIDFAHNKGKAVWDIVRSCTGKTKNSEQN